MANLYTHLAIAKKYIEKHPGKIENAQSFYDGNVMPDLVDEKGKESTHYGNRDERKDLLKRMRNKVGLFEFLQNNKLDTDLNRGRFLHLYTDWEYYNNLLAADYLSTVCLEQFQIDHIYTCIVHSKHVRDKYSVTYCISSFEKEINDAIARWRRMDIERWGDAGPQGKLILSLEQIEDFIERISSVNLDELAQIIKTRIQTPRLVLRPWTLSDTDALIEGLNDFEVAKNMTVPFPYTREHAIEHITKGLPGDKSTKKFHFAAELKDTCKVIGGMSISVNEDNIAESGGIWVNQKYHGRGFGTEIWRARAKYCFDVLGVEYLENGFFEGNQVSWRMQEKIGYKQTGERVERFCPAINENVVEIKTKLLKKDFVV